MYSRDPVGNDEMYAASGIGVLGAHGFVVNAEDRQSAREAQRALANTLLMAPKTRQFVVDCGFHEKAAEAFTVGADAMRERTPLNLRKEHRLR